MPRKNPVQTAVKSPVKRGKRKYKTPGYQSADELRAAPPNLASEEAPATLLWFPDAQPGDRIRVMRLDDRSRKWSTHGYFAPEEGYDERVAELWGGGEYWAQWLRRNTLGAEQIIGSQRPVVPGMYKPPREVHGLKGDAATGPGAPPTVGRIPDGVNVKEFLDNVILARSLDALEQRSAPAPVAREASSFDRLLDTLAPAIPDIIKAFLGPRGNPAMDALVRRVEELAVVVNRPAPTPAQGAMSELISGLKGLTQVREMLMGDGPAKDEKEDPMWKVANKAFDLFNSPAAQRSLPAGQPPEGALPAPEMPLWQRLLLEYQARLVDSAQRAIEPELVAELVARYVPDTQRGVLVELIHQPNVDALIVQVIPAMQNFPTWLHQFTTALHAELVPSMEPEGEPESEEE